MLVCFVHLSRKIALWRGDNEKLLIFPLDNGQKYIKKRPGATENFTQNEIQIKKFSQTIAQLWKYEILSFNVLLSNEILAQSRVHIWLKNRSFLVCLFFVVVLWGLFRSHMHNLQGLSIHKLPRYSTFGGLYWSWTYVDSFHSISFIIHSALVVSNSITVDELGSRVVGGSGWKNCYAELVVHAVDWNWNLR